MLTPYGLTDDVLQGLPVVLCAFIAYVGTIMLAQEVTVGRGPEWLKEENNEYVLVDVEDGEEIPGDNYVEVVRDEFAYFYH